MRGIEMIKDNRKRTISVKKELILSGGAVNSPVLLMLSGIGPKQHLVSNGVRMMTFHLSHLLYRFILHILYDI
jgi:choline dehydrogenase-like flavoprotein